MRPDRFSESLAVSDPLALWRGIDDAVQRQALARAATPRLSASALHLPDPPPAAPRHFGPLPAARVPEPT